MLKSQPFVIYTDPKLLTFRLSKVANAWTAMPCRQLSYSMWQSLPLTSGMCLVWNVVANTLFRPPYHTS